MTLFAIILLTALFHTSPLDAQRAVILTTDFTTGSLSVFDTQTQSADNDLLLIHGDAVVQTHGENVYVLNRLGQDNIIVLSKDDLANPIVQYSTGDGSNPQDIAFASDTKGYVTLYERPYLLVLNPATGDSLGIIDLSAFADDDGIPEMAKMAVFGNHLFVAAQRLDRNGAFLPPTEFSVVIVIDMKTDTIVDVDPATDGIQGIRLQGTNPSGGVQRGGKWILATVGAFSLLDGGLEVVNLSTMKSEGLRLTEEELGGDVGAVSMLSDTEGYLVITDENFSNSVKRFNLNTGTVSAPLSDHSGGFTPAIAVTSGSLYVLDRGSFSDPASAGLKIYSTTTGLLTSGPISTGLPPSDIVFIDVKHADFDDDNDVDFDDFLRFAGSFGKQMNDDGYDSKFDLNHNGVVDFPDFLFFAEEFGN